jgi:hypothetical protein
MLKVTLSATWFFSWAVLHYKLVPVGFIGAEHTTLITAIGSFFGGYLGGVIACMALILSFHIYTTKVEAEPSAEIADSMDHVVL